MKVIAMVLLASSAFVFFAQNWQITDGYNIAFSSDDAAGVFKGFKGSIAFDEQNPAASKFGVTIDATTINTGNGLQNKHAKSDEWFDVAKYPQISFQSKSIAKAASGYTVTGDLTLHGVTKTISFPFTFAKTPTGGLFKGSFAVNRNDYKLGKPGGDVGESIKVDIAVPVTK